MQPMKRIRLKGFTLVELAVVIVIVGIFAAFGVPKFINSVERSKALEAFAYLSALRDAEQRFLAKEGVYASDPKQLDIVLTAPRYFAVGAITITDTLPTPGWTCTLTRIAATSSKGSYTVTFTQDGYDSTNSTLHALTEIRPVNCDAVDPSY